MNNELKGKLSMEIFRSFNFSSDKQIILQLLNFKFALEMCTITRNGTANSALPHQEKKENTRALDISMLIPKATDDRICRPSFTELLLLSPDLH